jgi:CubicO group peptidase (beta-lactamase class C family)
MPLVFDPGDRWEYGINLDWVGKMVEAVTGEDLDTVMRTDLFEPLGMDSTGFKISASQRERIAEVHLRGPGGIAHLAPDAARTQFWMGGGGSLDRRQPCLHPGVLRGGELDGHRAGRRHRG